MTQEPVFKDFGDDFVPPELWGEDHWTTLAYVETVMVDCAGFQIGADPRMRTSRQNYRGLQRFKRPKRASRNDASACVVMEPHHASRLSDGTLARRHDDWCCLQDMAAQGFFTEGPEAIEPRETLHFSDLGRSVVNALREHRSKGGKYSAFEWRPVVVAPSMP